MSVSTEPVVTDTNNPIVDTILKSGHSEPPCAKCVIQPGLGMPMGVGDSQGPASVGVV